MVRFLVGEAFEIVTLGAFIAMVGCWAAAIGGT